jgi:putative membrane protein
MVNWSEPQKQSAFGIFMFAGKAFRQIIAIIIVFIGGLSRKEKPLIAWVLAFGGIALFVFGKAFLEYFYFTFQVSEGQLIIKKGIFSKKTLVIPFERIQTVQLHQNLLHKIINHCKVAIDTAGSEETEVAIQSLSYNKAISLKELLTQQVASPVTKEEAVEKTIRLSPSDLFKMALSANHLETFGLLLAFVIARFEDVKDLLGIDAYDWVEEQGKGVAITTQMIGIMIFFALSFSILISVLRIVLKFSDLTIHLGEKGFQLKHGMLSSQQQFIGSKKIQFIQWNANWIRRKIGMYMFHIKTAGETDLKKKQKIHVPVTREEHLHKLGSYYQDDLPSVNTEAGTIQPQYFYRQVLYVVLPVTIIAMTIIWIWWNWYAALFLIWSINYIIKTKVYRKNFKIWVNDDAIEISKGVWGRQRLVINWHNLQVITVQQSIYQRRKGFANLSMQTASGEVNIPYLKVEEAQILADHAAMKIEASQKNWM